MDELIIDVGTASAYLKEIAPEWEWLLRHIESENGHLRFPLIVARAIVNLKIESYPLLYENEAAIGLIIFRAFTSQEEMVELNAQLNEQSAEERGQTLRELMDGLSEFKQAFEFPKTSADERRATAQFNALSKEDQTQVIKMAQNLSMGFLAGFWINSPPLSAHKPNHYYFNSYPRK